MRKPSRKVRVDAFGNTDEGKHLRDYNTEELIEITKTCWYKSIVSQAKAILQKRAEMIDTALN